MKISVKAVSNQSNLYRILIGLSSFSIFTTILLLRFPALAQINLARLLEIIGNNEAVFIEQQVAQVNDTAALGEEVRTEQARTQLSFNNGAEGRMDENTSITVGQCVEVQEGVLVASGPANGCLVGFGVGVQGTIYLVNVDAQNRGTLNVLQGQVRLGLQNNFTTDPNALTVQEGQKITGLVQGLALSEVVIQQMTKQEYEGIITGRMFKGYQKPLPEQDKINEVCKRLYGNCAPVGGTQPNSGNTTPVRGLW